MNRLEQTIVSAADGLAAKSFSSLELTQAYVNQIRGLDGSLHAYLTVLEEEALSQARQSDERRRVSQTIGPLDGIPIAVKDNILIKDERCTAGSRLLDAYVASYDATIIKRLKQAGAIFLGKTNMDEFAMGSSTEHSAFGPTKNPHDVERVPGGSSGGSACAVAADLAVAALGTDTGGSIRQPAALCGVVGFKPTYGRVSRSGIIAMASSLDQVGPLTKTVRDAAILFEAIQGIDPSDQTTMTAPWPVFSFPSSLRGLRIGLPRQAWGEGMGDEVRGPVTEALGVLRNLGAEILDVDLPYADEALAVYYVLMPCEVSSNMARFDGIRYGWRAQAADLMETYGQSRAHGFGMEVRRRILLGTFALSKGYYEAYYRQARKVQALIARAYETVFSTIDLLVTPTVPHSAFRLGEKLHDPLAMYAEDIYTVGVNVAGLPAVSVPCPVAGMPVGLQLIGPRFQDVRVLDAAYAYEQARV